MSEARIQNYLEVNNIGVILNDLEQESGKARSCPGRDAHQDVLAEGTFSVS